MSGSTSKVKPKMADVTKPKKVTNDDDQLVIQSRPMIGKVSSGSSPVLEEQKPDDAAAAPSAPTLPSQSKRTLIVPISDDTDKPAAAAAAKADATAEAPKKADAASKKPADTPEPAADDEKAEAEPEPETTETGDKSAGKDEKPNPETEKALAEAAAAEKRQHELEALIDSKQFYVPINAVAQKKSIKVSSIMTFLVFLLAIVLVDLMLDSGTILLVQKIPHTHFFTQNN